MTIFMLFSYRWHILISSFKKYKHPSLKKGTATEKKKKKGTKGTTEATIQSKQQIHSPPLQRKKLQTEREKKGEFHSVANPFGTLW